MNTLQELEERPFGRLKRLRLSHPLVLLLGAVGVAAALTWIIPAGEYQRRTDAATGREVVVAETYARVEAVPCAQAELFRRGATAESGAAASTQSRRRHH